MNMAAPLPAHRPVPLASGDARLIDTISPEYVLKHGVLPVRRNGSVTLIATESRRAFRAAQPKLEAAFGPVAAVPSSRDTIRRAVTDTHGAQLARRAAVRTMPEASYRTTSRWSLILFVAFLAGCLAALGFASLGVLSGVLVTWVAITLVGLTGLRTAGAIVQINAARRFSRNWRSRRALTVQTDALPSISLLVPLFNEPAMIGPVTRNMERLDYPRSRLEVILILEAGDQATRDALQDVQLPHWVTAIEVPPGEIQTKPRALNYALDFAAGDIIGIYDAEDAPAEDQLLLVAEAFKYSPPNVACLQGILDFYNTRQSWLTRCFTIDYAAWFRLILPGLVRLGFAIPLGGTTVFLKREVLEKIGRWDAHNVTEDADLGIRLARRGYQTAFIPSVTMEEATSRTPDWVRQRSRWIKGYAMTWAVHMRRPIRLYQELGTRRFWVFQILFLGALSQFFFAPLLWSFWLLVFGIANPITAIASQNAIYLLAALFFLSEVFTIGVLAFAVSTPRHRRLIWWVPVMHFYFLLSAVASWKAMAELVRRPFFWDKTEHGQSLSLREETTPADSPNPA